MKKLKILIPIILDIVDIQNERIYYRIFKENLENNLIYMTYFQVMEIFYVLGFRGTKLQLKIAKGITEYILKSPRIIKIEISPGIYKKYLELSAETGIYVWDFLCILPLKDFIDKAYSIG